GRRHGVGGLPHELVGGGRREQRRLGRPDRLGLVGTDHEVILSRELRPAQSQPRSTRPSRSSLAPYLWGQMIDKGELSAGVEGSAHGRGPVARPSAAPSPRSTRPSRSSLAPYFRGQMIDKGELSGTGVVSPGRGIRPAPAEGRGPRAPAEGGGPRACRPPARGDGGQPSATTMAEAMPASWEIDRCQLRTPSSSARAATEPRTCTTGAPPTTRSTVQSCHDIPPGAPSALAIASLAANRAASEAGGSS